MPLGKVRSRRVDGSSSSQLTLSLGLSVPSSPTSRSIGSYVPKTRESPSIRYRHCFDPLERGRSSLLFQVRSYCISPSKTHQFSPLIIIITTSISNGTIIPTTETTEEDLDDSRLEWEEEEDSVDEARSTEVETLTSMDHEEGGGASTTAMEVVLWV